MIFPVTAAKARPTLGGTAERILTPGDPFTAGELQAMALDQLVVPLYAECYLLPGTACAGDLRGRALALSLPPAVLGRTVAGRLTAAWIYGCAPPPAPASLLVDHRHRISAVRPFGRTAPHRFTVHEVALGPCDVAVVGGMAVTTPLRTAVDLALHAMPGQAEDALRRLTADSSLGCPASLVRKALEGSARVPGKREALQRLRTVADG